MAIDGREDVYATLLLNDVYLPGALVLAHSLRDAGTKKKLAVLITMGGGNLSTESITELQKLYDYIIPVERIVNTTPANLHLMNRLDLSAAFTKIELWKQERFRRILYIDADVVALRAPDELFALPHSFSAAPDIGWPDIFNTGVMVLDPNMGDYYALLAMAQRGISFDGADQGLLNMHFKNSYNRLSFTYNVTPSGHYQYLPAYRHFQSSISMVHFIGHEKPWMQGREANQGDGPYNELVGRWWAVYDKYYRATPASNHSVPEAIQKHVKEEYNPSTISYPKSVPPGPERDDPSIAVEAPMPDAVPVQEPPAPESQTPSQPEVVVETFKVVYSTWDPTKAPPPADSKPEALNFPAKVYTMSSDTQPFKAPERYPDPPKDMYYEVPKTPTYQKPSPIFPWEKIASKATRVFAEDIEETAKSIQSSDNEDSEVDQAEVTAGSAQLPSPDPWQSYARGNAWDDIPQIETYIGNLQKNRRAIQAAEGSGSPEAVPSPGARRRPSMRLTDFPTEVERPSLPVTPTPIHRSNFWGSEMDQEGELPAAEGVPPQDDWDPVARLELLAQRQAQVLSQKLGQAATRELPSRSLPFGSEGLVSPTYLAHAYVAPAACSQITHSPPRIMIEPPSYTGPGAAWEKEEAYATHETPLEPSEEEKDVLVT